jgi:hypothetical protein
LGVLARFAAVGTAAENRGSNSGGLLAESNPRNPGTDICGDRAVEMPTENRENSLEIEALANRRRTEFASAAIGLIPERRNLHLLFLFNPSNFPLPFTPFSI